MDRLEILLKEYETLRAESLASMNNRISILTFGLAIIGAIITASLAVYAANGNVIVPGLMLALTIPFVSIFVLFMWLGEYQRMQRAGAFLAGLEKRINYEASKELLTWETSLRANRQHMKYPYNTTVLLLLAVSAASYVIGIIIMPLLFWVTWLLALIGIGGHALIYRYTNRKIVELSR